MLRRELLAILGASGFAVAGDGAKTIIEGKLRVQADAPPALVEKSGKTVVLDGDDPTLGVLRDPRLAGKTIEVHGEKSSNGQVRVGPIHKHSLFVLEDGKRKSVSYWCDVCSIRTYTPGVCMCCQAETELELKEHEEN